MWSLENIIAMNKQWQDEFDDGHPEVARRRNLCDKSASESGASSPKCNTAEEAQAVAATVPKAMQKREAMLIRVDIEIRVDIDTVEV